jgi:hypothetical protein
VLFKVDDCEPFSKVSRPPWSVAPRAILQPNENFKFAIPGADTESRKLAIDEYNELFEIAIERLKSVGGTMAEDVDYKVFEDAGRLLYEGSFVAERVSGVKEWYDAHPAPTKEGEEDALLQDDAQPKIVRERV